MLLKYIQTSESCSTLKTKLAKTRIETAVKLSRWRGTPQRWGVRVCLCPCEGLWARVCRLRRPHWTCGMSSTWLSFGVTVLSCLWSGAHHQAWTPHLRRCWHQWATKSPALQGEGQRESLSALLKRPDPAPQSPSLLSVGNDSSSPPGERRYPMVHF